MKPQKGFSADVGDYSLGIAGPDQLEKDLTALDRMFDPNATHENGSQGGIGSDNMQDDSVNDNAIGDRAIDQNIAEPVSSTGKLSQILSWFAKIITGITGKSNWFDTPSATIESLVGDIQGGNIGNLVVGENVVMGPNASIAWGNVTGAPTVYSETAIQDMIAAYGLSTEEVESLITNNTINADGVQALIEQYGLSSEEVLQLIAANGMSTQDITDMINGMISTGALVNNQMLQDLAFQWADDVLALITTTYIDANGVWTNNVYTNHIIAGTALIKDALIESISADKITGDIIIGNTVIINQLSADKGNIAELTVDQIDTSDFVQRYLAGDTSPVGYWKGYDQTIDFYEAVIEGGTPTLYQEWSGYPDSPDLTSAYPYQAIYYSQNYNSTYRMLSTSPLWKESNLLKGVAGTKVSMFYAGAWEPLENLTTQGQTILIYEANNPIYTDATLTTVHFAQTTPPAPASEIQVTNRLNQPIYWLDDTHVGTTLDVTAYPVMRYVYNGPEGKGVVKLKWFHEIDPITGFAVPKMVWGQGYGQVDDPDAGKGFLYKDGDSIALEFIKANGDCLRFEIGEDGIKSSGSGITNIGMYADGMLVSYTDGITEEWDFTRDGEGNITQALNLTSGLNTVITWNTGNKP